MPTNFAAKPLVAARDLSIEAGDGISPGLAADIKRHNENATKAMSVATQKRSAERDSLDASVAELSSDELVKRRASVERMALDQARLRVDVSRRRCELLKRLLDERTALLPAAKQHTADVEAKVIKRMEAAGLGLADQPAHPGNLQVAREQLIAKARETKEYKQAAAAEQAAFGRVSGLTQGPLQQRAVNGLCPAEQDLREAERELENIARQLAGLV
jgi:hypothetical protein